MNRICVIGLGYIGLPTALLLARAGFRVTGVDIDASKVALLQTRQLPFEEKGLPPLYRQAKKNFTTTGTVVPSEVYIICVPTPVTADKSCDNSYVRAAAASIVPVLRKGATVILESTVVPGTTEDVVCPILEQSGLMAGRDFYVGFVSEKAIPGNTIHEMMHNDRVISGITPLSASRIRAVYRRFVQGTIHVTDCRTAETVKLVENTYRDINIAFANELSGLSRTLGVNVWEVIRLANLHPRVNVHSPGPGVGGHCIALDPWFLVEKDRVHTRLIQEGRRRNDTMPDVVADHAISLAKKYGTKTIGILGVAYKRDIDDARESPAIALIRHLEKAGLTVLATDPLVKRFSIPLLPLGKVMKESDALIVVTDHAAYARLHFPARCQWVLDTRGIYEQKKIRPKYFLLGRDI